VAAAAAVGWRHCYLRSGVGIVLERGRLLGSMLPCG